ncbi:translin-associated factor X-interacting protein 1-like isoform X2 [Convolutriloba macropyga]|uniref:translin-associated factor X-interacting protein 1-like isoform X2 n=1 Tax=Convolutriloba macropyga TaxID=536237 RepID=UPI003F522597
MEKSAARLPPLAHDKRSGSAGGGLAPDGLLMEPERGSDMHRLIRQTTNSNSRNILQQPVSFESWPAYATGPTFGQMTLVKKHCGEGHSELINPWEKKVIPKPKFLEQLEGFLHTELRALDCPQKGPSELRLQVFREVFEYLISDFKTYRPLLSAIKNEYELVISDLHQKIRELEPLKQMLVTVSERCDQKIMQIQEQERQDLVDLRKENIRLLQKIDSMKEKEKDYQAQIDKISDELAREYERYKNECDQRRMLVQDLNEMRYQREQEQSVSGGGGSQIDGEANETQEKEPEQQDDPIILKIALRKCREANEQLTAKLNETLADYANVVPRRHFEILETDFENYKAKMKSKEEENEKFTTALEALNKSYAQLVEERDAYYIELETLKRASTPRPRWDKCGDYISGGTKRWKELASGKRSENLVDILLSEISGADLATFTDQEYFQGLGMDESVALYLRFEGQIKNVKLDRINTSKLIKEYWKMKIADDAKVSLGTHQPMPEYLDKFLRDKYDSRCTEMAYNLNDACQRFSFDSRIKQFFDILQGRMDEDHYHKIARMTALLQRELEKVADGNTFVTEEQMKGAIKKHIGKKSDSHVIQLVESAQKMSESTDQPNQITFTNLFQDNEEGTQSEWLELLYNQDTKERLELVEQIEALLSEKTGRAMEITGKELREAILAADEKVGNEVLEYCICWAFDVLKSDNATYPKPTKDVILKLQSSALPLL